MQAEIIAIGTEILLGEIVDTNSAWIAQRLPQLGIDLNYTSVVGDNKKRLDETFKRAWSRSDLIITTGGLGPTVDDMTREGICALLDEEPHIDKELELKLRSFFANRGYEMPESNLKQAWLIPSAKSINNPRGTAPGWWVERDKKIIISMPGVPPEMERMWENEVSPTLQGLSGEVLITRTLKTVGIGEGTVDEMAQPVYETPGIGVGTYARADGVHIRIGAKGTNEKEALSIMRPVEEKLEKIYGQSIWGKNEDTLEGVIAQLLVERTATVSVLETTTGGLLSSTLADAEAIGEAFLGAHVIVKNKQGNSLGIDTEKRSEELAADLAKEAQRYFTSDYGVGVTGVLEGESGEHPPGTIFVAVSGPNLEQPRTLMTQMSQGRAATKRRAITTALLLLRRVILELET